MMQIYNRVLPSHSGSTLMMLTGLVCFALAALAALETVRAQVMVRLGAKLERDLNQRVVEAAFLATLRAGRGEPTIGRSAISIGSAISSGARCLPRCSISSGRRCSSWPSSCSTRCSGSSPWAAPRCSCVWRSCTTSRRGRSLEEAGRKAGDANSFMERSLRNAQTLEAWACSANLQRRWLRQRNETLRLQARAADRTGLFTGVTKSVQIPVADSPVGLRRHAGDRGRDHAGRDRRCIDADGPRAGTTGDHDRRVAAVRRRPCAYARLNALLESHRRGRSAFPAGAAGRVHVEDASAGFPVTPPRRCGT